MTESVLDRVVTLLDDAHVAYDANLGASPIAVLWPDKSRQFESVIHELQNRRRIVRLGDYDTAVRTGPAYWIRCVISGTIQLDSASVGLPIVYLPGVGREDLRAAESLPLALAPLVALQHRSLWFTQPKNSKDWTVRSLLQNKDSGLGCDVANDDATSAALIAALPRLGIEPVARLQSKYIDANFLNGLVHPDPVRTLLEWINAPAAIRESMTTTEWTAFEQQCQNDFGLSPSADGEIAAARKMGDASGAWQQVWKRFREAPTDFPDIPNRLRQARPDELILANPGSWPSEVEGAEASLRGALVALELESPSSARVKLAALEHEHKVRRGYVWAELDWSPLAMAIEHLAAMAVHTANGPSSEDVGSIVSWYAENGWKADAAVVAALNEVHRGEDVDAVAAAITAVYQPWLDAVARKLQDAVGPAANAGTYLATVAPDVDSGEVIVFVDGLRLDIAHLVEERLVSAGLTTDLTAALAALPTVTQTAKPVLVPIDQQLLGPGDKLDIARAADNGPAGIGELRKMMNDRGMQVLAASQVGDVSRAAWTETGEIDHRGHGAGYRVVYELENEVRVIANRVIELVDAGWRKVTIVTDHGWLLLPGGLPKNEDLPVAVTAAKKGRCARIKEGATVSVPTVPWHWDANVRIALAPGISCFTANETYEHGGVSPQECVVPRLIVTPAVQRTTTSATLETCKWKGLTLVVEFSGFPEGARVDLRSSAADATTSIAELARVTGGTGKVLLFVEDDDLEGQPAQLVVVSSDGTLIVQRTMTVGLNH